MRCVLSVLDKYRFLTCGIGHLALIIPKSSIIGVHTFPNKFLNDVQALGILCTKTFSFQPPLKSFVAILKSNYF